MSGDKNSRAGETKAPKNEQPGFQMPSVSRWLSTARRKYGMFLAVVCVTALASATLFSFAGMTQQEVRLKNFDNEEGMRVDDAREESMADIRKAFEESGNDQQNAPSKYSASSGGVNLLCRFSPRYRAGVYPYGICSHFIYASVPSRPGPHSPSTDEVLYNYDPGAFKKFLHVRETAGDVRLLLSVEVKAMLHTGWSAQKLASDARAWLDRSSGVDGLHLAGLDLLPRNVQNITEIITALRDSFKRQYLITIGIDRTQKTVESGLLKILKLVDFASFKTSYVRHTDERTTLTNPYSNTTTALPHSSCREIDKLVQLAARSPKSHLCFTLTIGGNQFHLRDAGQHGLGAAAKHVRDASYAEICKRQWKEVKYVEPAIGYYARSENTWVGYDTEKTIAAKVRLALRKHPDLCVMLVQVDKDDIRGICSEKHFPLVQSVRHAMRLYHRAPPAPDGQVGRTGPARSGRE